MSIQPTTRDAYNLLHQGAIALNRIQADGMKVDVPYLTHQVRVLGRQQTRAEEKFNNTEVGKRWKKHYGRERKLGSDQQLSHLLFKVMGLESSKLTGKKKKSVARGCLEELDVPGLSHLIEWKKIDKTLGTYIHGILKEQTDGILRPFFHLGVAVTYRSSSSAFSFQTIPVRDPEQGKAVRQAILPWPEERIIESDYSGLEVRIGACLHQDPNMLKYLAGSGDMHADSAADLFFLLSSEVPKEVRFHAKNGWVFPQFYGSYWGQCAPNLWKAIGQHNLVTAKGTPLKEHLSKNGIRSFKNFENHCKEAENELWNKRFRVYRDWKLDQIKQYEKRGYVDLVTGFRCSGPMSRNEIANYGIQGPAFHCLLWALIRLSEIKEKEKWQTRFMGQIHDSTVASVPPCETDHVLDTVFRVSEQEVREAWDWIIIPLEVEAEATGVNESWYGKTKVIGRKYECCSHTSEHRYGRVKNIIHEKGVKCLTCGKEGIPF